MILSAILSFMLYLPPSLRERKRYLLFEVMSERELDKRELLKEIWDSMYSLYGDLGASESKLWLIDYRLRDGSTQNRSLGILRCAHDRVDAVRASLACIHALNGARVGIRVIKTSGTIKGVKHPRR